MKSLLKSIFVLFTVFTLFTSCQKEEVQPCNCGIIIGVDSTQVSGVPEPNQYPSKTLSSISQGVFPDDPTRWFFRVTIQNESNANIQDFYFINFEYMDQYQTFNSPGSIGNLMLSDDSTFQMSQSNLIGKRYCVYNKGSHFNYNQTSNNPIYW